MSENETFAATGHNSKNLLNSFVVRIDRIEDERAMLAEDIRSIYAEAKKVELNVPALRQAVKLYRMDAEKRVKHDRLQETVDQYVSSLGLLADLPLGQAAVEREFG